MRVHVVGPMTELYGVARSVHCTDLPESRRIATDSTESMEAPVQAALAVRGPRSLPGVTPYASRNTRMKCAASAKPHS